MNETELLARLRAEIPLEEASPEAERLFLAGLARTPGDPGISRRTTGGRPGAGRSPLARRLTVAGGLTMAAAAAVAVAVVMAAPHPAGTAGPMTVRELAYRAAAAAGRQPQVRPGQWVYWKEKTTLSHSAFEVWTTANPTKAAIVDHGHVYSLNMRLDGIPGGEQYIGQPEGALIPPAGRTPGGPRTDFTGETGTIPVSYAGLSSLPRSPGALLRYLAHLNLPHRSLWGPPAEREFDFIEDMLTSYVMPPQRTAELYRALGAIPGVTVDEHAADLAGRHGLGFISTAMADKSTSEIIVNPRTYQLMGQSDFGPSHHLDYGTAILSEALVSGPGVQP